MELLRALLPLPVGRVGRGEVQTTRHGIDDDLYRDQAWRDRHEEHPTVVYDAASRGPWPWPVGVVFEARPPLTEPITVLQFRSQS